MAHPDPLAHVPKAQVRPARAGTPPTNFSGRDHYGGSGGPYLLPRWVLGEST